MLRFARAMQRDVLNRGALRDAGSTGSPWAVVRTPGRVSGRIYDTPVGVQRVGDELYISLVYGEGTQWLRNVRAAGGATVLHDGNEIEATAPELVPIGQTPIAAVDRLAIFDLRNHARAAAARGILGARCPRGRSRRPPSFGTRADHHKRIPQRATHESGTAASFDWDS